MQGVYSKLVKKTVGFGQNLKPPMRKPEADPNPLGSLIYGIKQFLLKTPEMLVNLYTKW